MRPRDGKNHFHSEADSRRRRASIEADFLKEGPDTDYTIRVFRCAVKCQENWIFSWHIHGDSREDYAAAVFNVFGFRVGMKPVVHISYKSRRVFKLFLHRLGIREGAIGEARKSIPVASLRCGKDIGEALFFCFADLDHWLFPSVNLCAEPCKPSRRHHLRVLYTYL